jgi:hypothetical protein
MITMAGASYLYRCPELCGLFEGILVLKLGIDINLWSVDQVYYSGLRGKNSNIAIQFLTIP